MNSMAEKSKTAVIEIKWADIIEKRIATLFTKKVKDLSSSFTPMPIQAAPPPTLTSDGLTCFGPLSSGDVYTLVVSNHATTCSLDLIPSSLHQDISHNILPFLTTLINSSFTSGLIPAPFNTSIVKPCLKKSTLDSADIWNYRPVSLLSFLSKTLVPSTTNCPPFFHKTTSLTLISQVSGLLTPLWWSSSQRLCPSVPPEPRPTR